MPRAFKKAGTFQRGAWTKMVDGKRHRVTCAELHLPPEQWTKEASYQAAVEHWEKFFAPKAPVLDPINQQLATILDGTSVEELRRLANQGAEARRILAVLEAASVDGLQPEMLVASPDEIGFAPIGKAPMPVAELATLPIPQPIITKNLTDGVFDDDEDVAKMRLGQAAKTLAKPKIETSFTLRHQADKLLEIERARETKATTYKELKVYTDKLAEMLGNDLDARTINEQTVTAMYLKLKAKGWSNSTRRKAWRIFRRLVKYLYSERIIDLPRNLNDSKLSFKIAAQKITRYTKEEVQAELKGLPDRLRLYALLGLNCGMLGVDMASIKWTELDQNEWRIKRKRTKTESHKDVPEVNYKLWPATINLLKKYLSKHETYVLSSKTNTPLWEAWIDENGNPKKKDLIVVQWRRRKHKIGMKEFRSIGATIIGDEKEKGYGRYVSHYLGHSPKTLADKHYVPPSDELFDEILAYVGRELGLA
jgi:site-specific recombinase XerD